MEPASYPEPFDSSRYYFQVKWDGVRMLAFVLSGEIKLQNRKGNDKTRQYPELQHLKNVFARSEAVLDGEVVAIRDGKPSFPAVMERDTSQNEYRINKLSRHCPVTYCIFDILFLDGEEITSLAFQKRYQVLQQVFSRISAPLYLNENFSRGVALFHRIEERSWEGIVAKEKDSPYVTGGKSPYWLKIKPVRILTAIAGGITLKQGRINAILLGVYKGKGLLYIGKVGSGLSQRHMAQLREQLEFLRQEEPAFINPPRLKEVVWMAPRLTMEVKFAEWTEDLMLRSPVFNKFSSTNPSEAGL